MLEHLQPQCTCCAILSTEPKQTYSLENSDLILDALYPSPAGLIVGGAFSDEEAEKMARLVAAKKTDSGMSIEFIKVPTGTFESGGPQGLLRKVKELLYEKFAR